MEKELGDRLTVGCDVHTRHEPWCTFWVKDLWGPTALTRELIVKAINVFDTGQHNETRSKIILMMNLESVLIKWQLYVTMFNCLILYPRAYFEAGYRCVPKQLDVTGCRILEFWGGYGVIRACRSYVKLRNSVKRSPTAGWIYAFQSQGSETWWWPRWTSMLQSRQTAINLGWVDGPTSGRVLPTALYFNENLYNTWLDGLESYI